MKNKFNRGDFVKVTGIGKIYGKVNEKLGFVIERDEYFKDYYIDLNNGKKDWFESKDITKVFDIPKRKNDKYQVRLCTTLKGYNILEKKLNGKDISNNKFKNVKVYRRFQKDNGNYIVIGWSSVYWPSSNKSIKILEKTLNSFVNDNIPFKYIVMNENDIKDVKILKFTINDNNVDLIFVERKIKIRNLNKSKGEKRKNDS